MLTQLYIENFILVERLSIEFKPGLNIFTGETGAGKTIIISALNAVLGERVTTDFIRTGAEKAIITGLFAINNNNAYVKRVLTGFGISCDNNELLLQREIQRNGKHICRINGKITTLSILIEIGKCLVDIHGQHQHQSLLSSEVQLHLLDRYGGLLDMVDKTDRLYRQLGEINKELNKLTTDKAEKEKQISMLEFEIEEINDANLQPEEDIKLQDEIKLLQHAQHLHTLASEIYNVLYEAEDAVYSKIYQVLKNIQEITTIDTSVQEYRDIIQEMYYQVENVAFKLKGYAEKICFDPDRLEECEARLDMINNLKRKYGNTIDQIIAYKEMAKKRMNEITYQTEKIVKLKDEISNIVKELTQIVTMLSKQRHEVAEHLSRAIEKELKNIAMRQCQFVIELDIIEDSNSYIIFNGKRVRVTATGIDKIEFLISPNIGELPRALSEIASGGELSRIMLAIKTILARVDEVPTLVFDEIDTGIDGQTSCKIAEKLKHISKNHQVICITHMPQIASFADHHLYVEKKVAYGRTTTSVRVLEGEDKIMELANMLGGISETSIKHAQQLIDTAKV